MRKITFISVLLFFAIIAKINAQDVVICTFEETPSLKRNCSAGASTFTTINPNKAGFNQSDSCGVYFRVNKNNYYAASGVNFNYPTDIVNFGQKDVVAIAAGDSMYLHVLVNSNTEIKPALSLGGDVFALNLKVNGIDSTFKSLNVWKDLVFKLKGGAAGQNVSTLTFRWDCKKALTVDATKPNVTILPPTTVLAAGTGIVYYDEIIVNNDSISRTGAETGINELNSPKQFSAYATDRKILVKGELNSTSAILFNAMGQRLSEKIFNNKCEFDVPTSGIYMVQINGKTSKVIVR